MAKNLTKSRLDVRIPLDVMDLLEGAAELRGVSVADFVIESARAAAERVLQGNETIPL